MMYHIALTLHLVGIVLLAGCTFMDFIFTKQFWKLHAAGDVAQLTMGNVIAKSLKLMGYGGILAVIAGFWMAGIVRAWGEQAWFQIKMGIVILLLINILVFRKKLGKSLKAIMDNASGKSNTAALKMKLNIVQVAQIVLIITIFVLSVFKFN